MRTKVILTILALSSSLIFSQEKVADKFFEKYAYLKAAELYQEAYNKGKDSEHVLTRLGDCYYNNSNPEEAAKWYKMALDKYHKIGPEYLYKYIQTQRSLGHYEQADEWLVKFKEIQSDDSRVEELDGSNLHLYNELASVQGVNVDITNLPINSKYADYGSLMLGNTLYFSSSRNTDNEIYKWNGEPHLDLYQATKTVVEGKIELTDATRLTFEGRDRKNVHEANAAVTNDGKTMYFTRDNVNKRNRLLYDRAGTTHLKIYKAQLIDSTWSNIVELPFNDNVYSTGHPALSPDNKTLYFVSDRDGGYGQTDLYKVAINNDGSYGAVENLGSKVNTEGREVFPHVAKDSTLYFSSDGFLNLGLLDIFKSNIIKDEAAETINLGAPYNSGYDDFAYFEDEDGRGYFASNRPGGNGSDDIYGFHEYVCMQIVKGVVKDSKTNAPLALATVQLIDEAGKIAETVTTNEQGEYSFEVDCNKTYNILGSKQDYKDDLKELKTTEEHEKEHLVDLYLIPLINDNEIVINPIFFNFDKWDIRPDAAYELENIVSVMRAHPDMVIKIESHTDSRGSDKYNMKLSDRRAKSTRDYLLSRNIAAERIESAIGYGESQLVNECANGVECSEEKHQENRRSKFLILPTEE
ncbi:membrane protein [Mangrovimonas yunxiaonensis]|uniref:Membrane protein n=1 Tax=Mangrovimonas yunxiaonensis TaxID=1197477 RepID=A0A084TMY0_9FLAO|nr:OmpA family protein [Mangrovimonas yunxiaonensis]KFB02066.1 membrane protein [Mangrovimonas yunxiaonensis]MBR9757011.1 OmpA family protein [Algicola sp.]GGH48152.1 cell envelope biogenesis protein OmpA [Mangrovimonas yunxiaonensis]